MGPLSPFAPVGAFNLDQVQNLIDTKGYVAFHVKASMPADTEEPTMGANLDTVEGPYRVMDYFQVKPIRIVPTSFNLTQTYQVQGLYGLQSVVMNVNGSYIDTPEERAYFLPGDLILLNPTFTEVYSEAVQYEPTLTLSYYVNSVDYLATRSQGELKQGVDFEVRDGRIHFTGNGKKPKVKLTKRPGVTKGEVVTVRYKFPPIYVVRSVPHSMRILPDNVLGSGAAPREARYAPQLVIVDRSLVNQSFSFWNLEKVKGFEQWMNFKP